MLDMFNEALQKYSWMVYACIICVVIFIVVLLILMFKPKKNQYEETIDEHDEVVREVVLEEKEKQKQLEAKEDNNTEVEEEAIVIEEEVIEETVSEPIASSRVVNGKYEVFQESDKFKYVLKASNGGILVESELYTSKDGVINAINAVKRSLETGSIVVNKDKRNLYQFSVVAANNRVLVVSANYPTEKRALNAVESFKRFGATSPIVEVENKRKNSNMEIIELENLEDKQGGKFSVISDDSKFVYQLVANNGEVLCTSLAYKTKNSCLSGIETLKTGVVDGTFYVTKDKRGYYQFKLYSKAGRIIVLGETYESKVRAISSANSLCSFIKLASPAV